MIAANGLLESKQCHGVVDESLARIEINGNVINLETRSIMKSQMRNTGK